MIKYDFSTKNVLVTGSSRGIGAAILEGFARAGASVWLQYWDDPDGANRKDAFRLADKLRALGNDPNVVSGDVSKPEDVQSIMNLIQQRANGLDILVNNAGILRDRTIRKLTLDDWRAVMNVNLDGVFYCCKYGVEILRDNGRIVSMASIAGLHPFHGQSNYAAAKAGVIALTKVLAKELARKGITANAIAPGVIETSMLGEIKPDVLEGYLKMIPVGRLGKPEDVANAVMFLASEESSYITGQVLPVTGGWY
jgi:3-oxoacyl-[acyl-carrier protein] reductase